MKMILLLAALFFLTYGTQTHSFSDAEENLKGSRFLSDDVLPKRFFVKSFLSSSQEEWCIEVVPFIGDIVINYCDIDNEYQHWTFDNNSRLQSLSDLNGCLVVDQYTNSPSVTPSINTTSTLDVNFEGRLRYAGLCNIDIDQSEVFVYNPFDNTISNMMMFLTVQNEPLVFASVNLYSKYESCIIAGQRWVLQSLPNDYEIKYLGNPCSDLKNGCPLCSGDCDEDSDCAPGLRCAQRYHKDFFRQNVPGCQWKYPNDPERFYQSDFCFQPISAPGIVNYVGECDKTKYRCKECEGHCWNDLDCEPGLRCLPREGFDAVPGCGGEAGERDVYGINICYKPSKPINSVRWGDRCTESKQCEVCTGNCSFDADCQGDLRCAKRDKGIDVPGCKFNKAWLRNDWDHNYCFEAHPFPANAGLVSYVGECGLESYLCNRCEGSCTTDSDCVGDLKCQSRNNFEHVPGCDHEGGEMDMSGMNVCIDDDHSKPTLKNCPWYALKCPECSTCKFDRDCAGELRCAIREGLEDVPGCRWGDQTSHHDYLSNQNYCFAPQKVDPGKVNYVGECRRKDSYVCGRCEGGCKYDEDCANSLKCLHRDGFDNVPGCHSAGGDTDMFGKSICYDPNYIDPIDSTCST